MIKPKGEYCDRVTQQVHPILVMDADEIKERADLNVANTATALRAKVVAASAIGNGHSQESWSCGNAGLRPIR